MAYNVGDTVVLDGIESVIVFDNGTEAEWGRYLCVDKNHDLSYYLEGSDFVNEMESEDVINTSAQYGYEWGGYGSTHIFSTQDENVGGGLKNTNALISLNLEAGYDLRPGPWKVLWDKVKEFRDQINSDKWFVPVFLELYLIYTNLSNLNLKNLSTVNHTLYWSSIESNSSSGCYCGMKGGTLADTDKYHRYLRSRLCRYTTDSELDLLAKKSIQITTSTSQASIYYTADNSTPTSQSNLYKNIFQTDKNSIVKAIGKKEGWDDSNIVVFDVATQTTTEEKPITIRQSETNKTVSDSDKNI